MTDGETVPCAARRANHCLEDLRVGTADIAVRDEDAAAVCRRCARVLGILPQAT